MTLRVLLHCSHDALGDAWRGWLDPPATVFADVREVTPDASSGKPPVDIIISDVPPDDARPGWAELLQTGGVGLVCLAPACGGDVDLPADVSPRELQLACRLLAEIVQLRRAHQATRSAQQHWEHLAHRDPLTGALNRRGWDAQLQSYQQQQGNLPLCVAFVDLDHFKLRNDTAGYAAGDETLRRVADSLRQNVRGGDLVARLGGDEFGLLLPGLIAERAPEVVDRIRRACRQPEQDGSPPLTASAGFALGPAADVRRLVAEADQALRRAKRLGRDRCQS